MRAKSQTAAYVEARQSAAQTEMLKKRPVSTATQADELPRPDCLMLSESGKVDCTGAVLQLAKQNLGDSFQHYGGADCYWTAVVYLNLRGDIVEDIRRGSSYLSSDEDIWMSKSVDHLLTKGLIDCGLAD